MREAGRQTENREEEQERKEEAREEQETRGQAVPGRHSSKKFT